MYSSSLAMERRYTISSIDGLLNCASTTVKHNKEKQSDQFPSLLDVAMKGRISLKFSPNQNGALDIGSNKRGVSF